MKVLLLINGKSTGALLLGRSSAALKGLTVLSGVIDADYTGIIQIAVYTNNPPIFVLEGSSITQLEPMTNLLQDMAHAHVLPKREEQRFGSTGGLAMLALTMN